MIPIFLVIILSFLKISKSNEEDITAFMKNVSESNREIFFDIFRVSNDPKNFSSNYFYINNGNYILIINANPTNDLLRFNSIGIENSLFYSSDRIRSIINTQNQFLFKEKYDFISLRESSIISLSGNIKLLYSVILIYL